MSSGRMSGEVDPFIDQVLNKRYRVLSVLGQGGMATAYLARDETLRRKVVVKVPDAELIRKEEGFRNRFLQEVRSLTTLPHASIVKVLDGGEMQGVPYVVLDYLPGGTLAQRVQRGGGKQSPAEVGEWLPPIARALDFIHGKGFVHRDVTPRNILFDEDGNAMLSDFGIAKALAGSEKLTRTGEMPCSPEYAGPELGLGIEPGLAYDQYSLAVVAYEALSGTLPHSGTNANHLITNKAVREPVPLGRVAPHVPAGVVEAVMKALSKNPEDRFRSCKELVQAFQTALHGKPPAGPGQDPQRQPRPGEKPQSKPEKPPVSRPSVPAERRSRVLTTSLLVALLVAAGAGSAFREELRQWFRGPDPPDPNGVTASLVEATRPPTSLPAAPTAAEVPALMEVEKGQLKVSSVPPKARVETVDQDGARTAGDTPLRLSLAVGDYEVKAVKAGYQDARQHVRVRPGQETSVDFELELVPSPTPKPSSPPVYTSTPKPPTPRPTPKDTDIVMLPGGVELELVWIPEGTFDMGCSPDDSICNDAATKAARKICP